MKTNMQKTRDFKDLAQNRKLCSQCPLSANDIEYKLIMMMTEQDPKNRPTAQEILNEWLPLLEHELELKMEKQPLVLKSMMPREISKLLTILVLFNKSNSTKKNSLKSWEKILDTRILSKKTKKMNKKYKFLKSSEYKTSLNRQIRL